MKPDNCFKCGKPITSDDKFCPHCGVSTKGSVIAPKKEIVEQASKLTASALLKWIGIALLVGLIFGWIRYWIGYYILIQGVIAGLLIPWLIGKAAQDHKEVLADVRFKMANVLFFSFIIAQAIGFGLAQPVFEPFGWFYRVWDDQTSESIFGIFSTGGVVHETFSGGLSGGFWAFLFAFDLFFMFFFILVGLPLPSRKNKKS